MFKSFQLQCQGYDSIDALDSSLSNLKELEKFHSYRNFIYRTMGGLNSTGLNDDVYDAVVIVGGFNPSSLEEILRITKSGEDFSRLTYLCNT